MILFFADESGNLSINGSDFFGLTLIEFTNGSEKILNRSIKKFRRNKYKKLLKNQRD